MTEVFFVPDYMQTYWIIDLKVIEFYIKSDCCINEYNNYNIIKQETFLYKHQILTKII